MGSTYLKDSARVLGCYSVDCRLGLDCRYSRKGRISTMGKLM